ncbi:MAG: lysoplasmalogenase family protein [Bacillota bacterium]|nr:lysoplasmalogenase family protein [Bacillota bacterium]
MNLRNSKLLILGLILIFISIIYISFLYLDFFNIKGRISSDNLKYITLLLCVSIALLTGKTALNLTDISLLQLGLILTAICDLCLLILDYFTIGVALFCIVQILYSFRYIPDKVRSTIIYFATAFLVVLLIFLISEALFGRLNILILIALFYAVCLVTSTGMAIYGCSHRLLPVPNRYLMAFGMIFFLLCDINVGLYNAVRMLGNPTGTLRSIGNISNFLMWFFYLPSQVMLSLSGYDFKKLFREV